LIALIWFVVLGLPAALLLDRGAGWRRLLGNAFLLGTGIVALIMLGLSVLGMTWTRVGLTIACSVVALALGRPASRRLGRWRPAVARQMFPARPARTPAVLAALFDGLTLLFVVAHGVYATAARVGVWDFWAIWGLKARVFFQRGAIDWAFLEHPYHAFVHPDYPPLLPLDYVFIALHDGAWNDRWLGILSTLFAAALLLVVRDSFAEELPRVLASAATFGVASIALSHWVGTAEAPMIAFGTAALLMLRRGSLALGAVFLGFAALTKNEGLALLVAVIGAMFFAAPPAVEGARRRWTPVAALWPSVVIAAPWLVLRALHALPTDLASGPVMERATKQFFDVFGILFTVAPSAPLFWIAVVGSLLVFARSLRAERFLLTAVLLQILFFVAAYIVTPNELRWHVVNSWSRLLDQVAIPLAYMALLATGRHFFTANVEICGQQWLRVVQTGHRDTGITWN
jgi:hypothetical protein